MKENGLFPKDTLNDSVHPNKLGNFLIAELIKPSLRYDAKFPSDPWEGMVRDVPVNDPSVRRGADGILELTFDGNRIDVIAAPLENGDRGTANVLIDEAGDLRDIVILELGYRKAVTDSTMCLSIKVRLLRAS